MLRLEDERPSGRQPRFDQILRDFRLAIDGDALPRHLLHVDVPAPPVERDEHAGMDEPCAIETLRHTEIAQNVDGSLLQHAGADARLDIGAVARFQDDVVDAGFMQQLAEQQPRGAGADDRDLCALHDARRARGSSPRPSLDVFFLHVTPGCRLDRRVLLAAEIRRPDGSRPVLLQP